VPDSIFSGERSPNQRWAGCGYVSALTQTIGARSRDPNPYKKDLEIVLKVIALPLKRNVCNSLLQVLHSFLLCERSVPTGLREVGTGSDVWQSTGGRLWTVDC
jgi:hypothetical protein